MTGQERCELCGATQKEAVLTTNVQGQRVCRMFGPCRDRQFGCDCRTREPGEPARPSDCTRQSAPPVNKKRPTCSCAPDCAERIECTLTYVGHFGCGWCDEHEQARHICMCTHPAPPVPTEGRGGEGLLREGETLYRVTPSAVQGGLPCPSCRTSWAACTDAVLKSSPRENVNGCCDVCTERGDGEIHEPRYLTQIGGLLAEARAEGAREAWDGDKRAKALAGVIARCEVHMRTLLGYAEGEPDAGLEAMVVRAARAAALGDGQGGGGE